MSSQDWETIKQVFSAALNVPAAARDAYLAQTCGDRDDLRHAIDGLLRAHHDASLGFLEPHSIIVRAAWVFAPDDTVAGRFRVVKPIARGAMGEVYQVYDERLRLHVALKAIRPELLSDAGTVERFRREVLVTRDIAHEGLCRVFDLVEHAMPAVSGYPDGTVVPCLTMQLLDGINLEDWLAAHRPLPPAEAMPLVRQIAEALQVLHRHGVVHRDLKPSNVMLVSSESGQRAVLTDFGLAKPLEEGLFETQPGAHGGAPYFMAPELFEGERPSRASDVYAFGLLIDEMITSRRAFSADSLHGLLLQKLQDDPDPPSGRGAAIDQAWDRAILRCLSRVPADRCESATDVLAALSGNEPAAGWRPVRRVRPATGRRQGSRSWRASAYAVMVISVIIGALTLTDSQATSPRSVVVTPFANLSSNPELDYLARGTAIELARRLRTVDDLAVYSSPDMTSPLDRDRQATFAVQGHVQQAGITLRITVEVTDPATKRLLWSDTVDDSTGKPLELQDALAARTVGALMQLNPEGEVIAWRPAWFQLRREPPSQLSSMGTGSNEAFDAYLRGRYMFEERTREGALQAIGYLNRAVQLDPNFAAAYAALADVQGVLMDVHHAPHDELLDRAERHATQAVALAPDLPDAQLSLAALRQAQWRWSESEAAYRRAIELHPAFARAHRWYGGLLLQFGRFDESLALYRKGLDLDPYDYPSQSAYGHALFHVGQAAEAERHLERVLREKDLFNAHALLGQIYAYRIREEPARASEYLQKALERSEVLRAREAQPSGGPPWPFQYADLVAALAWSYQGDTTAAAPFVDRLEAGRSARQVSPGMLARVYAAQGNAVLALDALHAAERQRDRELLYVEVSPHYASIRAEAQFRALVQRLGLSR